MNSDFLESLEDQTFFNGGGNLSPFSNSASSVLPNSLQGQSFPQQDVNLNQSQYPDQTTSSPRGMFDPPQDQNPNAFIQSQPILSHPQHQSPQPRPTSHAEPIDVLPSATKTELFLLTAADQEDGTRDERLARVIHAKYEAGLLKPFNYVKGYARLSRWMEQK